MMLFDDRFKMFQIFYSAHIFFQLSIKKIYGFLKNVCLEAAPVIYVKKISDERGSSKRFIPNWNIIKVIMGEQFSPTPW